MQGIIEVKTRTVATYEYKDVEGRTLYIKERVEPARDGRNKEFFFKHHDGNEWTNGRSCDSVLYNLPEIVNNKRFIFVEGEGKADLLKSWGLVATCLDAGANSPWKNEYTKHLEGKEEIVILPDNDKAGMGYALRIANALQGKVGVIKVVELSGLQEKGDIIDWKRTVGNDKKKLLEIINETPEWIPSQNTDESEINGGIGSDEEWQDPIPFDDYSNLPEFPVEILPETGRKMVDAVSRVNQVDKGLPACMYLAALSTCLSQKIEVDLGTHVEPVNIYTCPILDPGERKTSTMRLMMSPIYEYQEEKVKEAIEDDSPPVYIVDDITSEALFKLMSENNERMSVISAEGGIFGIMAGRYNTNGNGNIDVYLKGHAGDPCSNHRISRKSQSMDSPCLTISLAVQRDIIKEIGSNRQFRGRGLLGRFLYCNCVHKAGHRIRQNESMLETLIQEYRGHILDLMKMPLSLHKLKLYPDAQAVWDEFYNDIEAEMQLGKSMASMQDWGSKLPGAVARIAGLLHYAEHGQQATGKPVSVNVVNASAAIGAYYREHALATFGFMGENPEIESAKRILEYLILHKPDSFKGRDILRHKNALKTMAEVTPGLKLLIERSYIREKKTGIFEINPILRML